MPKVRQHGNNRHECRRSCLRINFSSQSAGWSGSLCANSRRFSDEAPCFTAAPTCERRRPEGGFVSCGSAPGDDRARAGKTHETRRDGCETRRKRHDAAGDAHETPFRPHEMAGDACEPGRDAHEKAGDGCERAGEAHESLLPRRETRLRAHETPF
jgi:hypothetical protein